MELGGFMDQGVEIGRFRGGFMDQGIEIGLGLGVEIGRFRDQGVEIGRFSGGDGWVYGTGVGDW